MDYGNIALVLIAVGAAAFVYFAAGATKCTDVSAGTVP